MTVRSILKKYPAHDGLYFPDDDIEFYVPKGYITPEVRHNYQLIIAEIRLRTLWV